SSTWVLIFIIAIVIYFTVRVIIRLNHSGNNTLLKFPPKINITSNNSVKKASTPLNFEKNTDICLKKGCPPLSILKNEATNISNNSSVDLNAQAQALTSKLKMCFSEFDISFLTVKKVEIGPVITRFTLGMSAQGRVSKITAIEKEICMFLQVNSILIIPSEQGLIIEIPNPVPNDVAYMDCIRAFNKQKSNNPLEVILGQTAIGELQTLCINKTPHLLIAGATGSGKSVCLNGIIASILFNATPDEVKFIFIDPKVVELSNYNGIPHLLAPAVTDVKAANRMLSWAVGEMEQRYRKFASEGVRNIESYNNKVGKACHMFSIVIIIDELADLMIQSDKENPIEESIQRLGQMARAAGIHLIVGTQRPSVDVITGTIKTNIPSRIAFAVADSNNSRVILDCNGAEKLLGKGDGLLLTTEIRKPIRFKSAFIDEKQIENIVEWWKNKSSAAENEPIKLDEFSVDSPEETPEDKDNDDDDGLIRVKSHIARQYTQGNIYLPGKLKMAKEIKMNVNNLIKALSTLESSGWVKESSEQNRGMEICVDEDQILEHLKKYDYEFYIQL
ncbi:DNA translocase FtsK, partial [Acetivibrio cellulolyticus]|uniref:DNA translocase FtsK n=1 Tax=Acetivibrio cellulolyticus TaxID=35830 RepID=UPI0002481AF1